MEISNLLAEMVRVNASDLFLSVGAPPYLKVEGNLTAVGEQKLNSSQVHELVYSILNDDQRTTFEATSELNMALRINNLGRFRINVFRQIGEIAFVARHIQSEIPSLESLGLPSLLQSLSLGMRGLVLIVGGTGTGKSTTLASMLDYRNQSKSGHILTIEDPIEFVHEHKKSLVNQREVGLDTESYAVALKNAMREAPDVIMIGEIRDMDTMKNAIAYAETGHLCLSTLHANNTSQAIDRILNFFPETAHHQVLQDLSSNLRAIISQRLPRGLKQKRVAAIEIMLNTPYISDLIAKGQVGKIREAMLQARELGCQTFDDALFDLVEAGKLSEAEALHHADSRTNLTLRFKLEGGHAGAAKDIKIHVAYAKFIDFSTYTSYRIRQIKGTPDVADRALALEESFRHVMFQKGLREDEDNPELELKYVFNDEATDNPDYLTIEDPVSIKGRTRKERRTFEVLKVMLVDLAKNKLIWQMDASRKHTKKVRSQSEINRDAEYLFKKFPPK